MNKEFAHVLAIGSNLGMYTQRHHDNLQMQHQTPSIEIDSCTPHVSDTYSLKFLAELMSLYEHSRGLLTDYKLRCDSAI